MNERVEIGYGEAQAHPSLALIKYWGKADRTENLPATPSLAVTLDGLTTGTRVEISYSGKNRIISDKVFIDGILQDQKRFYPFFTEFRKIVEARQPGGGLFSIRAESSSDFPTAAGLASSSSGFAALAVACCNAAGLNLSPEKLSSLARVGSASAARSIYGGFTRLNAESEYAEQIYDKNWWPDFRIIVLELEKGPKAVSSRQAMEITRLSSPYYKSWVQDSKELMEEAVSALTLKDLEILGPVIRKSYLRMFATMLSADPPIIYWKPVSLSVIRLCEEMRSEGISVWETMDAGPQVKLFCNERDAGIICRRLDEKIKNISYRVCSPGGSPLRKLAENEKE